MAALTESVSKAKASRGEDADVHDMPKKTAKKQSARKTAAKKTARKPRKSA
jgi:DNA end-binding protein Ku